MDQRMEFARRAVNCPNFRELCREYGISAKTGYKWRDRFIQSGEAGMKELSRRPHAHAESLDEAIVCEIIRLKQAHVHWGPRKIQALYARQHGGQVPSESSCKRVLERAGLTVPRRRKPSADTGRLGTGFKAEQPNDVWTVDFKGWWRSAQGERVEPLTVRDEYSRMILEMRTLDDARTESVRDCFEPLFRRHGLPRAIRSDNGSPFAVAHGLLGLTRLSVWWLALGIDLERGRPGRPQDNGAHERLHKDIWCELERSRMGPDQAAFDIWREEFNTERPHESLGMRTPAELYRQSEREYEGTPEDIDYGWCQSRRVQKIGTIRHQQESIFLSTALGGWSVGLSERADGLLDVWFSKLLLGQINPNTASFTPVRTNK